MLIAQISDLHLPGEGQLTYGHVNMAAALRRVVAHVNALSPLPDLAIVTGDLTNAGSPEETRQARDLLAGFHCPHVVLPGNHDLRATLRAEMPATALPAAPGPFLHYALDHLPLRLLALDSVNEGKPGGALCPGRLDWLAARLKEAPGRPTMLFLHHPPLPLGVPETDQDGFAGAEDFGHLIADHPNILRIAAGHIHLATTSQLHGCPVVTAPSLGMQLTRDFSASPPPSGFTLAAPGYLLHHFTASGGLVSHVVMLGDSEKRHEFAPNAGDAV